MTSCYDCVLFIKLFRLKKKKIRPEKKKSGREKKNPAGKKENPAGGKKNPAGEKKIRPEKKKSGRKKKNRPEKKKKNGRKKKKKKNAPKCLRGAIFCSITFFLVWGGLPVLIFIEFPVFWASKMPKFSRPTLRVADHGYRHLWGEDAPWRPRCSDSPTWLAMAASMHVIT